MLPVKLTAFAALIAFSTTAAAQEPAKVWADATCKVLLSSDGAGGFTIATTDGSYKNSCRISDWPTSSPAATMICADNTQPTMTLDGDSVIFEGVNLLQSGDPKITLRPKGDPRITCD